MIFFEKALFHWQSWTADLRVPLNHAAETKHAGLRATSWFRNLSLFLEANRLRQQLEGALSRQHTVHKADHLHAEPKLSRKLAHPVSGCRTAVPASFARASPSPLAPQAGRMAGGTPTPTLEHCWAGISLWGLVLVPFGLDHVSHRICAWTVRSSPWNILETRLKSVCLCWLRIWGYYAVDGTLCSCGPRTWCQGAWSIGRGRWSYRQVASQSNWRVAPCLNHLLSCVDRAVLPRKRFFFFYSPPAQSFHHFAWWVIHIIVNHASDLLKNWCLAFSVIETDFLPYFSSSHLAVGSPLRTHGTGRLLSACGALRGAAWQWAAPATSSERWQKSRRLDNSRRGAPVLPERGWAAPVDDGNTGEWQDGF